MNTYASRSRPLRRPRRTAALERGDGVVAGTGSTGWRAWASARTLPWSLAVGTRLARLRSRAS